MARPTIEPIEEAGLDEFASFLHQHLNRDRSPEVWAADFRRSRRPESPNYGFSLHDDGRLVGGIGALYADRVRQGQAERLCNITSWCVLPEYRQHSTRLVMALLAQGDRVYTDFSPTKVVAATLRFLKFSELDDRRAVCVNLPRWSAGFRLRTQANDIESSLRDEALRAYRDHRNLPWLNHLVLERDDRRCHVIYKKIQVKGVPAAFVLHADDPTLYASGAGRLAAHWWSRGLPLSVVELRTIPTAPRPHRVQSGFNRKVVLAPAGLSTNIDYLYSETLLFDLT
jgi:hypothetical protein